MRMMFDAALVPVGIALFTLACLTVRVQLFPHRSAPNFPGRD